MATPIDFDGEMYDEPIPDVDFRVGAPRTRWGWKRALKKLIREEESRMTEETPKSNVEMFAKAVEHGRRCQDLENAMLWDEYTAARKEWLEFLDGLDKDARSSLSKTYWAERDRGLTGE